MLQVIYRSLLGIRSDLQSMDIRASALTVVTEHYSNGKTKYIGYHANFNAAEGNAGWLIDYFEYVAGRETNRRTYSDSAAVWDGREGYFL